MLTYFYLYILIGLICYRLNRQIFDEMEIETQRAFIWNDLNNPELYDKIKDKYSKPRRSFVAASTFIFLPLYFIMFLIRGILFIKRK